MGCYWDIKIVWTEVERNAYKQIHDSNLAKLYSDSGIPQDDPEERARYLAEEVLPLTATDHDLLMRGLL